MKQNMPQVGLIAIVALLFLQPQVSGIGIGIAPNDIEITNALRGTEYVRTLTIFNPGELPENFTLSAEGDASGWVSFRDLADSSELKNMIIAGNGKQSILLKIAPPEDEPTGKYNATIYAKTVPIPSNSTEVEVKTVLMANAIVTVELTGDQIIDGAVNLITIESDTEPGYPLRIGASFKNTGNVVANPEILVSIMKDDLELSSFVYREAKVRPDTTETIIAEWNTTSEDSVGDYLANVEVYLEGRDLAATSIPFRIEPTGTFSRQGNFTKVVIEDAPAVDAAVKINAYFANTGRIDTLAKFSGEVYRDGARVDTISSDELMVKTGEETPLASYLKLSSPGNYSVNGRIVYSGKETEPKEISFAVPEKAGTSDSGTGNTGITGMITSAGSIYAAAIIVAIIAAILLRRRSKSI